MTKEQAQEILSGIITQKQIGLLWLIPGKAETIVIKWKRLIEQIPPLKAYDNDRRRAEQVYNALVTLFLTGSQIKDEIREWEMLEASISPEFQTSPIFYFNRPSTRL